MRGEMGKLVLDKTFEERENLNHRIRSALNNATSAWGIECMRYEIKDIKPPEQIKRSMDLQAESERIKRSKILDSEGARQSKVNIAEGIKQSAILEGQGAAERILQEARSIVESLDSIAKTLEYGKGDSSGELRQEALKLRITEKYLAALQHVLGTAQIVMLPKGPAGGDSITSPQNLATALNLYKKIVGTADSVAPSNPAQGQSADANVI
jgi:regulator of protease activity HflC (stomatin/prohibitin superfamily)